MKGLSIEEKAKAYDKAIERARKLQENSNGMILKKWLWNIFPELKESEDEKIRKELLEHCINRRDGKQVCVDASDYRRWADWLFRQGVENIPNVSYDKEISNEIIKFLELPHPQFVGKRHQEEWIAWLEKQGKQNLIMAKSPQLGEQKPFDYEDANIQQKDFAPKSAMEAAKEKKIDNANKVEPKDYNSIDPHFFKTTDKVEPKFKVGDWISGYYRYYKVLSLNNDGYMVEDVDGDKINILFENEKFHHLFTIADAKDGDVLVSASNQPFIYEGEYNSFSVGAYCGIDCIGEYFIVSQEKCRWTVKNGVKPATKEQRDTLLKAMTDAGYTFDFEKKELKKIENTRPMLSDFFKSEYERGKKYAIKELKKIESQYSQWNISDFRTWQYIVSDVLTKRDGIGQYLDDGFCKKIAQYMQEEWSKKLSFEQNPSWSEEEKKYLELTIYVCHQYGYTGCENWLKSLKDRYTWKPSEEQMEAVKRASNGSRAIAGKDYLIMKSLYNDLEKLTE